MSDKDKINPAWKTLLEKIPPEFHNQILPDLQAWDKGVQERFQEIHQTYEEYKPYKALVDNNIDPDYAFQSVSLADELQRDPAKLMSQVNEAFGLGYLSKAEAEKLGTSSGDSNDDSGFLSDDDDLLKNPKFRAMQEALEALQSTYDEDKTSKQQQEEEDAAIAQFNEDLDALEKKYTEGEDPKPFHRTFVTALMAQGIDGDAAVEQYHKVLAGSIDTTNTDSNDSGNPKPPVVMGNGGSVGAGTDDNSVDYGKLSTEDLADTVEQLLAAQANSGQG